jgi:branched-chain amino acid transport system permease protein
VGEVSGSPLVAIGVSGVVLGSLYALLASGLSLIWSTLKVFNFAHGATLMLGAYITWTFNAQVHLPLLPAAICAMIVMVGFAALFELTCVRPFIARKDGDLLVMIATLAAATIMTNAAQLIWGPNLKQLPQVLNVSWRFAGTAIGGNQLAAVAAAPLLLGATLWLLRSTRIGLAIRAVEQNRDFAGLVGIRAPLIYTVTIGLAAVLATAAGVLLAGIQFLTPDIGSDPLLKAFVVVVFGGLASLQGTIVGAYVIGLLEAVSTYYIGLFWTPVVVFVVMIAVMLVKPEGVVSRTKAHT